MWITPKTDWTADDCLDLATDFSRIEGNIHEILLIVRAARVYIDPARAAHLDHAGLFDRIAL